MQIGPQKFPFIASSLEGKGKLTLSTTSTLVSFTMRPTTIVLTSDVNNTDMIYYGGSSLDSSGSGAVGYLSAGDSITLNYDTKNNNLYVIAASGNQYLWAGAFQ